MVLDSSSLDSTSVGNFKGYWSAVEKNFEGELSSRCGSSDGLGLMRNLFDQNDDEEAFEIFRRFPSHLLQQLYFNQEFIAQHFGFGKFAGNGTEITWTRKS